MCANTYDNWHKNVSTKNPQSRTNTIYIIGTALRIVFTARRLLCYYSGKIITVTWLPALLNSLTKLQMSCGVRASTVFT